MLFLFCTSFTEDCVWSQHWMICFVQDNIHDIQKQSTSFRKWLIIFTLAELSRKAFWYNTGTELLFKLFLYLLCIIQKKYGTAIRNKSKNIKEKWSLFLRQNSLNWANLTPEGIWLTRGLLQAVTRSLLRVLVRWIVPYTVWTATLLNGIAFILKYYSGKATLKVLSLKETSYPCTKWWYESEWINPM